MINLNKMNRVIALVYYGRSGTIFLQSLLDGHPNIVTVPTTLLSGYYRFWNQFGNQPTNIIVRELILTRGTIIDATQPITCPLNLPDPGYWHGLTSMWPAQNETHKVDRDLFLLHLYKYIDQSTIPISRKFFFQAIHAAYYEAVWGEQRSDATAPIILWHLHGPALTWEMGSAAHDFPDMLFIQPIRNPINCLGSTLKHLIFDHFYADETETRFQRISEMIILIATSGGSLHPFYRQRSRLIKLEDIHLQPREIMVKLCEWINIPGNDSLLKSTFGGKQWWNIKEAPVVSGPNEKMVDVHGNYQVYFTAFDVFRLEIILRKKYQDWKYPFRELTEKNYPDTETCIRLFQRPFLMEKFVSEEEGLELRKLIFVLYLELTKNPHLTFELISADDKKIEPGWEVKVGIE